MQIIAVMLAIAAIMVGAYALTDFVPSRLEYELAERIRRSAEEPVESQFVAEMEAELRQERNSRWMELLTAILWSGSLGFLAILAAHRVLRRECPSLEFEPRVFQPLPRGWLGAARRFSSAFLARGERVAQARSNLRPTLERLFGSKEG